MKKFTGSEYLIDDLFEEIINLERGPTFSEEYIRNLYHKRGLQYWKDSEWFKNE